MSLDQDVIALLAVPVFEEAIIEIVPLGLVLFLNILKKLEGIRLVCSLFHLFEHLGMVYLPQLGEMITLGVENHHLGKFLPLLRILEAPEGVVISWVLTLIEELLCLCCELRTWSE